MGTARAWMLKKARQRKRVGLDAALFAGGGLAYVSTRLKLPLLRAVMRAGLHTAELMLLSEIMPYEFLIPLFALRAAPSLLGGLHWGALEALRDRVRRDALGSRASRALVAVEAWLLLSAAAAILLFASVAWLVLRQTNDELGPYGLYGAFALVVSASTAIELWSRTFHSGIFALGRVYKPVWGVMLPEVTELLCLLSLWKYLGPFALHVGVLFTAMLKAVIGFRYGARAYRSRNLSVPHPCRPRALFHFGLADLKGGSLGALASLPLQLDRLLLLALLGTDAADETLLPLSAPYYAMRPVAGLTQSWARVFYADLVRLNHSGTGILRERFERLLLRVAAGMALLSSALLALGSYLLFERPGLDAAAWFLPLAFVRGLFAVQQLRAFVFAAHARLIVTGLGVVAGLLACTFFQWTDRLTLLLLTLLLALSLLGFRGVKSKIPQLYLEHARKVSMAAWLSRLVREARPVRLCVGRVDASICQPGSVALALARALQEGQVTRLGRTAILWWEPVATALTGIALARATGCALAELNHAESSSGRATLMQAHKACILPRELLRALEAKAARDPLTHLAGLRTSMLPGALCITLTQQDRQLGRLNTRDLIRVRHAIMASAREQKHIPRWAPFQAAAFAPGGELRLAFVWTRDQGTGSELRRAVLHESWRASAGLSVASDRV